MKKQGNLYRIGEFISVGVKSGHPCHHLDAAQGTQAQLSMGRISRPQKAISIRGISANIASHGRPERQPKLLILDLIGLSFESLMCPNQIWYNLVYNIY